MPTMHGPMAGPFARVEPDAALAAAVPRAARGAGLRGGDAALPLRDVILRTPECAHAPAETWNEAGSSL